MNHKLAVRCMGYECKIREGCAHYVRPINYAEHFFQPVQTGEDCHQYASRNETPKRRHEDND